MLYFLHLHPRSLNKRTSSNRNLQRVCGPFLWRYENMRILGYEEDKSNFQRVLDRIPTSFQRSSRRESWAPSWERGENGWGGSGKANFQAGSTYPTCECICKSKCKYECKCKCKCKCKYECKCKCKWLRWLRQSQFPGRLEIWVELRQQIRDKSMKFNEICAWLFHKCKKMNKRDLSQNLRYDPPVAKHESLLWEVLVNEQDLKTLWRWNLPSEPFPSTFFETTLKKSLMDWQRMKTRTRASRTKHPLESDVVFLETCFTNVIQNCLFCVSLAMWSHFMSMWI